MAESVFAVCKRLSDGQLFDVLTEIPEPADWWFDVQLRNQHTGRKHWTTVAGLTKKYQHID